MALTGTKVKSGYPALLALESNNITSTYKNVEDGEGNPTQLYLKDTAVGVGALEFTSTPSTATAGSVDVLTIDGGVVKKATIAPFGQAIKDIYQGFWYYESALGAIAATAGTEYLLANDGNTTLTTYVPTDLVGNEPYDINTYLFFDGYDEGDSFRIVLQLEVTTGVSWATGDYVSIGIDSDGDTAQDFQVQDFPLLRGVSQSHPITVSFEHYVTAFTSANGFGIYLKPVGHDVTYTGVKTFILRTNKR